MNQAYLSSSTYPLHPPSQHQAHGLPRLSRGAPVLVLRVVHSGGGGTARPQWISHPISHRFLTHYPLAHHLLTNQLLVLALPFAAWPLVTKLDVTPRLGQMHVHLCARTHTQPRACAHVHVRLCTRQAFLQTQRKATVYKRVLRSARA
eukprot:6214796-Pleurochrysis_carterae.AAC.2